ncbi:hypothetical protein EPD60_11975 [Flaviaesturariibacter flavus]|uniref:Beta-lactamase class A catalytic domain-containing protein n=1 Tax=Flaviaesturariibacter flavus TaxID=2502780 RepID=A0A4R1BA37_9BACT|nr:serine hydrolase [Flaviaesturariibacter flavus]TCJ13805.1 hypothetical protein EPD60_11975 [Flaviaesturariibacter flavus]
MTTGIAKWAAVAAFVLATLFSACRPARRAAAAAPPLRAVPAADPLLDSLLRSHPEWFDTLLRQPRWGIQILYTRVDRDSANHPHLTHFGWGDFTRYFYPASTVKLPAAALALQRLEELGIPGLDKSSTMITEAARPGQARVYNDPEAPDGRPTIETYIRKALLVSDNDAFNRLYEFLGQEYLNQSLQAMGYDSTQIVHRLAISLPEAANRATNPVQFFDTAGHLQYAQQPRVSSLRYAPRSERLGTGFIRGSTLVNEPFDFSRRNRLPLPYLHQMMISLAMPDALPPKQRFRIGEESRRFLLYWASRWPREADFPRYDSTRFPDTYAKFLLYGAGRGKPRPGVRIFNKIGNAYGFLVDAAYIVDFDAGVEFFLSAVISCNSDGIYNDDRYDYNTAGYPFMQHLGEVLLDYERARPRARRPDLSALPR